MKNSKLVQALAQLKAEEVPRFRQFVASPYYNQREELIPFLEYMLAFWPGFSQKGFDKKAAFESVYPEEPYRDKTLRYLMSWLNQLLEQFWLRERQAAEKAREYCTLMEIASERGLEKTYRQYDRKLRQLLEGRQSRDVAFFRAQLKAAEARERHFQRLRQRRYDLALQEASDFLDRYYYLERLKYACAMLDRQAILQADYHLHLSPDWLEHLRSREFFQEPLIELYYLIFITLQQEEDEQRFRHLRSRLDAISGKVSRERLREIYHVTINYCARKIRQGKEAYVNEALRLYTDGISRSILFDKGELSPWAFTNVVKLALRLKRYQWIEKFIEEYGPQLPAAFRENALHYNRAELYYYTQRFDEAQRHLNEVAYSDLNYYLGARTMLAKIYYEKGEEEALLSLLAAFTIFLKRNRELSSQIKQTFLRFCELLYQLVRSSPRKLAGLEEAIESAPFLSDRNWLLEALRRKRGQ